MTKIKILTQSAGVVENITSLKIERDFDNVSGSWEIQTTFGGNGSPIGGDEKVVLLANGFPLLIGRAEKINWDFDGNQSNVRVSGRDLTSYLIDCTLEPADTTFKSDITIYELVSQCISKGKFPLMPIDLAFNFEKFEKTEAPSMEVGQKIWEFLSQKAAERNVNITSFTGADVTLTRAGVVPTSKPVVIFGIGEFSNVISCSGEIDVSNRYGRYVVYGQKSLSNSKHVDKENGKKLKAEKITSIKGEANDPAIDPLRVIHFKEEQPTEKEKNNEDRATWKANKARTNSKTLTYKIKGFFQPLDDAGIPWVPNARVGVLDQKSGEISEFFVKKVAFTMSSMEGARTTLTLGVPDAFTLAAGMSDAIKKAGQFGSKFR